MVVEVNDDHNSYHYDRGISKLYLGLLYIEKKVTESFRYIEFHTGISPETRGHISMDVIRLSKLFRWEKVEEAYP